MKVAFSNPWEQIKHLSISWKQTKASNPNADTNGRGEGVQGRDRTASDQAEQSNKGLEDTRLGIQDFQVTEITPFPDSAPPV